MLAVSGIRLALQEGEELAARKVADYGCILSRMFGNYSGVKGCVSNVLGKRAVGILTSVA